MYNIRYLRSRVENVCDKCGGPLFQRSDDTPQVIKDRIGVYERQTQPLLQNYREKRIPFIEFRTEKPETPPEVAVEEIVKGLKRLKLD